MSRLITDQSTHASFFISTDLIGSQQSDLFRPRVTMARLPEVVGWGNFQATWGMHGQG